MATEFSYNIFSGTHLKFRRFRIRLPNSIENLLHNDVPIRAHTTLIGWYCGVTIHHSLPICSPHPPICSFLYQSTLFLLILAGAFNPGRALRRSPSFLYESMSSDRFDCDVLPDLIYNCVIRFIIVSLKLFLLNPRSHVNSVSPPAPSGAVLRPFRYALRPWG